MTSEPVRDPLADHLLTPQNCALVIIDYQPVQVRSIKSMDQDLLVDRVVHPARFGMLYRLPIVLSTVNVSTGLDRIALAGGKPTSVVQVGCELQRDWGRQQTAEGFAQILFGGDRPLAGASTEPAGNGVRAGR